MVYFLQMWFSELKNNCEFKVQTINSNNFRLIDRDIFRNEREVANENPTWSLQQEKLCICWAKKPTIVATGERHKFYLFSSPKPFYRFRALSWPCSTTHGYIATDLLKTFLLPFTRMILKNTQNFEVLMDIKPELTLILEDTKHQ